VQLDQHAFLIDCGEGTQFQIRQFQLKTHKLQHIFISHLHGDHYFGLFGLLGSMSLQGRDLPLHLYAPPGLDEVLASTFRATQIAPDFPIYFHPLTSEKEQLILDHPALTVTAFPLSHRVPCFGFRFDEKPRLRKLLADLLPEDFPFELRKQLRNGQDVEWEGRAYPFAQFTAPPPPPRSYAYCTDTVYLPQTAQFAKGVDLLYHEATFMEANADKAPLTGHSTAKQAAQVALEAGAKSLILGHFSVRYPDLAPLLQEAQSIFPATFLAEEGKNFEIAVT
jgi:ribonuclease Z